MERKSKSPLRELDMRMTENGYMQISQGFNIHTDPPVPRVFIHPSQFGAVIATLQSYQRDFERKA
jgi:hypothetical protein